VLLILCIFCFRVYYGVYTTVRSPAASVFFTHVGVPFFPQSFGFYQGHRATICTKVMHLPGASTLECYILADLCVFFLSPDNRAIYLSFLSFCVHFGCFLVLTLLLYHSSLEISPCRLRDGGSGSSPQF